MAKGTSKADKDRVEGKAITRILSAETGELFMDMDGAGYIFTDAALADEFVANTPGTEKMAVEVERYAGICWAMTSCGIRKVVIDNDPGTTLTAKKDVRETKYANPTLNRVLNFLLQTNDRKYLEVLGTQHFLVPVKLKNTETGPEITYASLTPGRGQKGDYELFYIAFSGMDEFRLWQEEAGTDYYPIEMEYWSLRQIIGESGVCVNPGQRKAVFLTPELVKMIPYAEPEPMTEQNSP